MFSLDKFYYILHKNLFEANGVTNLYYYPFGSTKWDDVTSCYGSSGEVQEIKNHLIWHYDQEPLYNNFINDFLANRLAHNGVKGAKRSVIFANSEHSEYKNQLCKQEGFYDWYYFFHGFAALDWYRGYKYVPHIENQFSKVFISLNRLVTQDRSYRFNLVANYIEQGILDQGLVSLQLSDHNGTLKDELFSRDSQLSKPARLLIYKNVWPLKESLTVDHYVPKGFMSADADLDLQQLALWNVVSETIFYQEKLHLTEKIFKPIVSRRPFILVGAPGNLAYLKSYGFKTFDRWIDESYDNEKDPDLRIQKITAELKKLCNLTMSELQDMHKEMKEVLEYNFEHFYGEFRSVIIKEMMFNLEKCIDQCNNGNFTNPINLTSEDFNRVTKILLK